jgi:hypothetical protein
MKSFSYLVKNGHFVETAYLEGHSEFVENLNNSDIIPMGLGIYVL